MNKDDKSFSLGEHEINFEKYYLGSEILNIPENWKDYYFTEDQKDEASD